MYIDLYNQKKSFVLDLNLEICNLKLHNKDFLHAYENNDYVDSFQIQMITLKCTEGARKVF